MSYPGYGQPPPGRKHHHRTTPPIPLAHPLTLTSSQSNTASTLLPPRDTLSTLPSSRAATPSRVATRVTLPPASTSSRAGTTRPRELPLLDNMALLRPAVTTEHLPLVPPVLLGVVTTVLLLPGPRASTARLLRSSMASRRSSTDPRHPDTDTDSSSPVTEHRRLRSRRRRRWDTVPRSTSTGTRRPMPRRCDRP